MGVKGLNRFITRFEKNVMDRIQIGEEIEQWKIDHDGKSPTILIDLKECAHNFVQNDELAVILGGRYDFYNKMLKQFLENLKRASAKLVFFMPGKKYTDDLQFFIPKTEENYMNSLTILDKIEEKCDIRTFLEEKNKLSRDIRMELSFNYNLKKLVRQYGDFHVNYVRHNQEIARYAQQHADEVLAVISNDTDFMAFEGDFEFWRANGINYKRLTGIRYNKKKLLATLGFEQGAHQMQLLSSLCGSNFLPIYVISEWVKGLADANVDPTQRGKIRCVSNYVKHQQFEIVKNKPKYNLDKISSDVFGGEYTQEQFNSIANGLTCYDLDFEATVNRSGNRDPPARHSFLSFCRTHDLFIYKLATDDIFIVQDITYMDFRNCRSKNYAELIIPILMKMCGILCQGNPHRPVIRRICMKHAHDEPSKLTEERVMYPPMSLPELFDLIFKNKERKFDKFRWPLLEWILDFDEGMVKKVRNLKNANGFNAVIITLEYLLQQGELTATEANAILYTEHKIRSIGTNQSEYPQDPNAHFIRIAHLYVKMYVMISHSLDICGLHDMTDLVRFDGPLFHKHMEKFEIANEQQMRVFKSSIEPIWTFT